VGSTAIDIIMGRQVLLEDRLVDDAWVGIDAGRIVDIGSGRPPGPYRRLGDGVLAPGLVDAQLNGAFGVDLIAADSSEWHEVHTRLPGTGVTAVVPTFITAPVDDLAVAMRGARRHMATSDASGSASSARTIGLHLEGPFLAPTRCGAHDSRHLLDPTPRAIDTLIDAGADALRYVTLAPERPGALTATEQLVRAGIRVAVGHSDASDDQVTAAADAGASLVTHLYNAQRPLRHRDPGVVGAALGDPRFTVGLIADLHHVAPGAIRVALAAASGRIMLVTDATAALGMPPGTYDLGGQVTVVRDGAPPVRPDGTIAGSALRLDDAVTNVVRCGVDHAVALTAASRVPADALGRADLGRLAIGLPADLVWLGEDGRTRTTWLDGRIVFGRTAFEATPREEP